MRIRKLNVVAARFEEFLVTTLVGFLFSLVVGLQGCATTGPLFKEVQVPEDKAVLYFYREWGFQSSMVAQELSVNGEFLVEVTNGGYIPYVADPGQVTIVTTQQITGGMFFGGFFLDLLCIIGSPKYGTPQSCGITRALKQVESQGNIGPGVIEVRANEVYYFKYKFRSGKGGFKLSQVPQEIGKQEIQGLNLFPAAPDSQDNQPSREGKDTRDQN